MNRIAGSILAGMVGLVAVPAYATPITFTITTTAVAGSLNGLGTTGDLVVTLTGDTSDVIDCGGGKLAYGSCDGSAASLAGTFTWGGSSGTFTDPFFFFNNNGSLVIGQGGTAESNLSNLPNFSGYDMVSAFGPASEDFASTGDPFYFSGSDTTAGLLQGGDGTGSSMTFQATVDSGVVGVPVPGELDLGLFGLGLLGLFGIAIKRRA